jgi:hypothetical protein
MDHRDLLSGFIRLHILHHAAEGELYGQWMMEELARHGYRLSPGTLYPLLHGLEKRGYLVARRGARAAHSPKVLSGNCSRPQGNQIGHGEGERVVRRNRAGSAATETSKEKVN